MGKAMLGCLLFLLSSAAVALGQLPGLGPLEPQDSPPHPVGIEEPKEAATLPNSSADGVDPQTGTAREPAQGEDFGENPVVPVGAGYRFWVTGEYLQWWIRDAQFPALVTTTVSATDALPGGAGQPGTRLLIGGPNQNYGGRPGGRFSFGTLFGESEVFGIEGQYLFLGARALNFSASASSVPGSRVLARPFFDVQANQENASLVTFPGLIGGAVAVSSASFLQGAESNFTASLLRDRQYDVTALAGFRFVQLDENLYVREVTETTAQAAAFPLTNLQVSDHFSTRNYFYGGQAGLRGHFYLERWSLELQTKVALGDVHQIAEVGGATAIAPSGQPATVSNGGLLALSSNSGHFNRDVFAVVPEVGLNIGYRVTQRIAFFAGYSFLYWSDVARPGAQVNTNINVAQVPTSLTAGSGGGPALPGFAFHGSDFWAQGVNFGLEVRY